MFRTPTYTGLQGKIRSCHAPKRGCGCCSYTGYPSAIYKKEKRMQKVYALFYFAFTPLSHAPDIFLVWSPERPSRTDFPEV